ncbi:MAG TPA: YhjD/YihY/BrkB family envelope integrity protein, partial [Abditibacteriaceae bacterium]
MTEETPAYEADWPAPLHWLVGRLPGLRMTVRVLWRFFERWGKDQCPLIAAAMAFFGLLSVFPIMLAVIAILGKGLVNNRDVLVQFRGFVASFFPGAAGDILGEIDAIAAGTDTTALGVVAIASLLWSGRAYFDTLAAVLNNIWPRTVPRAWWQHQLALWSL